MGVLSEATYIHTAVNRGIARIQGQLFRARRARDDGDHFFEELSRVEPIAKDIAQLLETFYARERDELFPRAMRIFGGEVEEVKRLMRLQLSTLAKLDQFRDELKERIEAQRPGHPVRLAYLELLFEEFRDVFDERREVERLFYQTCSTLLYPGGVSTD